MVNFIGGMMFNATFNNISVTFAYYGGQFYWWKKPEYSEETTDLSQVTDQLYHMFIQYTSPWAWFEVRTHNFSGDRHCCKSNYDTIYFHWFNPYLVINL